MIDDGPFARRWISRAVKRFDLDLARWPWPPSNGGDWSTYWEFRVVEVLSTVGVLTRKLIEADKISVELLGRRFDLKQAPLRRNRIPDKINFPDVDRFYDVENPRDTKVSLVDICNWIVHSFVLVPEFSASPLTGLRFERFYLASDKRRQRGVLIIEWPWFTRHVVGAVCSDEVVNSQMLRLPSGGSLSLPTCRDDAPLRELVALYCSGSPGHRKRYDEFLAKWVAEVGEFRRRWPTSAEARAALLDDADTHDRVGVALARDAITPRVQGA